MNENELLQDPYYILATTSLADAPQHVLKHGELFAVFDHYGHIRPLGFENHGLFYQGTRFLSRYRTRIHGQNPLLLSSTVKEDNDFMVVDLTNPDFDDPVSGPVRRGTVHIERISCLWEARYLERLHVSNFSSHPVEFTLSVEYDADYSDIFEVRGTRRPRRGEPLPPQAGERTATLGYRGLDGVVRRTQLEFSPPPESIAPGHTEFRVRLAPQDAQVIEISVGCVLDEERPPLVDTQEIFRTGRRHIEEDSTCHIDAANGLVNDWLKQSRADLHILLTRTETGLYPFAGIPWFSTVFGRDGILTALQTLWYHPEIARGVLGHLALTQAMETNAAQEAEPGKILHEQRRGEMAALGEIPFGRYYGSVDSTPLFVMLAGAYLERTGDLEFIRALWPNIEAALRWIDEHGDLDGDGFVEYMSHGGSGLVNQGWKDSDDAVFHADGRLAQGPIALCEVQGYVYDAKLRGAQIASALGRDALAASLTHAAQALKKKFNEAFWCEELGLYALALCGDKTPCRVRGSNAGHALFTGIAYPERAHRIDESLMDKRFFSGWGVRTIAEGESRYNPMSYHNGSIWPHDNAFIALGLSRYGHKRSAARIMHGLFDASLFLDLHRLPELFCGFRRRSGEGPTLYPVACDPQAWAAGAAFLFLQACLGLRIDAPHHQVIFDKPMLPEFIPRLSLRNLRVNSAVLDITLERHALNAGVNVTRKTGAVDVIVTA